MELFDMGLGLALAVAVTGILYRVSSGCRSRVGCRDVTCTARFRGVVVGPLIALSTQLPRTVAALLGDIVLLARTGQRSAYRWCMHMLLLIGFLGLVLFHAMDSTVTTSLFGGYEAPLDPWQWLRNLGGAMVLAGVVMATLRRLRNPKLRMLSNTQDWALLLYVAVMVGSGFLLEAGKLTSEPVFDRMVEEYGFLEDEEIPALRAHWAMQGVVFAEPVEASEDILELGAEVSEVNCSGCHSPTASAFVSRPLAAVLAPVAPALNKARADLIFYWLHAGLAFLGIALLPWGKFLHPLSTPGNLTARGVNRRTEVGDLPAVYAEARRSLGLDACTRCGECSLHCSVWPSFAVLENPAILPSEKLAQLKSHAFSPFEGRDLALFSEGSRICTECHRCTELCSAGIDLQDLWMHSRTQLDGPHQIMRRLMDEKGPRHVSLLFKEEGGRLPGQHLSEQSDSFLGCVQCTTCTSVCPVVAVSEDPTRDLDLMPQQIMNLLRMGLSDRAMGARMVWACTTCYKCQEHCPQNIRVADILFELRNRAAARLRDPEGRT